MPPEYDLEQLKNITIEMFITTSDGDPYCRNEDFQLMVSTFRKAKITARYVGKYNHLDYLWGQHAHKDIYHHMLQFLNNNE